MAKQNVHAEAVNIRVGIVVAGFLFWAIKILASLIYLQTKWPR